MAPITFFRYLAFAGLTFLWLGTTLSAQTLSPADWGAPATTVTHADHSWVITGKTNVVTINDTNLAIDVRCGGTHWTMVPSGTNDMVVKSHGNEFNLRLADA